MSEFVERVKRILVDRRNVYNDVRREMSEELLRLEPKTKPEKALLRRLALDALDRNSNVPVPGDVAPLLVLRFCDKRSVSKLYSMLEKEPLAETARSRGFVLASYGDAQRAKVVDLAKQTLHGPLGMVASVLLEFESPPDAKRLGRLNRRLNLRMDPALGRRYVDMRSILQARLMCANSAAKTSVFSLIASKWMPAASAFELELLNKLDLA